MSKAVTTIIKFAKNLKRELPRAIKGNFMIFTFFILLVTFLTGKIWGGFTAVPLLGIPFKAVARIWNRYFHRFYVKVVDAIEKARTTQLKRSYLISLAYKNLMVKKTRSFITILGMSVGVGIVVFLLSLGYGLERLIVSRVASLDELKMIDVSTGENTTLRLNSEAAEKIKKMKQVEKVIPLISLVGRINYNKANTDTVVYAVSRSYLEINKIKLKKGSYFTDESAMLPRQTGEVAGAQSIMKTGVSGTSIRAVDINIKPEIAAIAWESCTTASKLVGYAVRIEGGFEGQEFWGSEYAPFNDKGRAAYDNSIGSYVGLWVRAKTPLFEKNADGQLKAKLDSQGRHEWREVCLQEKDLQVFPKSMFAEVLGESTSAGSLAQSQNETPEATESALTYDAVVIASSEGGLEVVSLTSSNSAGIAKKANDVLKINMAKTGEAIVSSGFLRLLNIPDNKAVGKSFKVQFIVVKNLMPEIEGRVLTSQIEYKIKGVVDDDENQYLYIPMTDAKLIGIKNYSQVKVVFTDKDLLAKTRKEIETMGFKTNSTGDTVTQIEALFANLRVLLGLLGMVALGVASLGMFNTLTVSLLERTREIGGMKTMGVVSDEIQDLFLAEAMIMGLGGGVGGLLLGTFVGKALSFGISLIAIVNGQGYLDLTLVPTYLIVFILLSSFIVGIITGFYPAQRAKKISALNALRYE
jgi:ABC-type lipoprotein release transport system permease subunit